MASAATRIKSLGPCSALARETMRFMRGENLTTHANDARNRLQIYVSTEKDPYLNLATEQHLLEVSNPTSTVLFLYINRPSVIIGRSQNPWLEVNLARLRSGLPQLRTKNDKETQDAVPVSLVRRRSGGGAVFHDHGNVNWSVIFPTAEFDRDRHAEMVVRALRDRIGVPSVRVNERHDIVMDVPWKPFSEQVNTFKVSGSAYRVTRQRSLHHGTCLVHSPYLDQISPLLRPPMAGSYLKTRGAGSVRSLVRNVSGGTGFDKVAFEPPYFLAMVIEEFKETYKHLSESDNELVYSIGPSVKSIPDVEKGYKELISEAWVYNQTPQFTFSTHPTGMDPRKRPPPPAGVLPTFQAHMTIRYGKITECNFKGLVYDREDTAVNEGLLGRELCSITDWRQTLAELSPAWMPNEAVGEWLNKVFGNTPEDKMIN
ncbi:hypothetical protein MCOR25_007276 [Pyricularia grisea]|uniref:Putative lipoate-protein ligase A n=1 Tax=Pyricularia grisea TaxID=148305 RepID=A0A6P8BJC1_PYRGI|nr:uncharacterized protein PgNI_00784 [Pyricularia grisea]KAI6358707.1 hypothetical protein MCOR25_007276 [Pyricularia grisea]TLD16769.1 hypothetical protein PgNI_00784 [Pyricularia grisea]